jgi:hypothetical protein
VREIAVFHDTAEAVYLPDGKTLLTTHTDGAIRIWDIPPRQPLFLITTLTCVLFLSVVVSIQLWRHSIRLWYSRLKHRAVPQS